MFIHRVLVAALCFVLPLSCRSALGDPPTEPEEFGPSTCAAVSGGCDWADCDPFDCIDTQSEDRGDGDKCFVSGATGKDVSDPVRFAIGDYQLVETDLELPGFGTPLRFTRTYRSKSGYDDRVWRNGGSDTNLPGPKGPIGRNWDHSLNLYVTRDSAGFRWVLHDGTGRADMLSGTENPETQSIGPPYRTPAYACRMEPPPETLNEIPVLTRPDGTVLRFRKGIETVAPWKVAEIEDRNGNKTTFEYYPDSDPIQHDQLKRATDAGGRYIDFTYSVHTNPFNQAESVLLTSIEDYSGREVVFTYYLGNEQGDVGNFGDLMSVEVVPVVGESRTWTYTYFEGFKRHQNNLKSIEDPRGNVILENTYSSVDGAQDGGTGANKAELAKYDAVIGQVYGNERYDYFYFKPSIYTGDGAQRVAVNRMGQVRLFSYDHKGQLLRRIDFTGTISDRAGFLAGLAGLESYADSQTGPSPLQVENFIVGFIDANAAASRKRYSNAPGLQGFNDLKRFHTEFDYNTGPGTTGLLSCIQTPADFEARPFAYGDHTREYALAETDPQANGRIATRSRDPRSGDLPSGYGASLDSPTITESWEYPTGAGGPGCGCAGSFASSHQDGNGHFTNTPRDGYGNVEAIHRGATSSSGTGLSTETLEYFTTDGDHGLPKAPRGEVYRRTHPFHGQPNARIDRFVYFNTDDPTLSRAGRLAQMIVDDGGLNLTTTYTYDAFGYLDTATDPEGNVTDYDYNGHGWLVRVRRFAHSSSTALSQRDLFYDRNGNLVREDVANLDQDGNIITANPVLSTLHDYDILDHRIRTCREEGIVNDLPAGQRDCLGTTVASGIDLTGDSRFITEEFEYDANDNPTRIVRGEAASAGGLQTGNTIDREYDERNKVFLEIVGKDTPSETTTRFDYDLNGNLRRTIAGYNRANPSDNSNWKITEYWHDGHDRLVQITDPMGNVTNYKYDNANNRVEEWVKGDPGEDLAGVPSGGNVFLSYTKTAFDAMNRPIEVRRIAFMPGATTPSNSVSDQITRYVYNPNSSIKEIARLSAITPSEIEQKTVYTYDGAHRLSLVTDPEGNTTAYTYDDNGNVLSVTENEYVGDGLPTVSGTPEVFVRRFGYDALDRMVSSTQERSSGVPADNNTTAYEYDSRGNVVKMVDPRGNDTLYQHDSMDRLVSTSRNLYEGGQPASPTSEPYTAITTTQKWDKSSRLIAQIDDNTNHTSYWYDEQNRLLLTRMADGTIHKVGTGGVTWTNPDAVPTFQGDWVFGYDVHGNATTITDANGSVITSAFDADNRLTSRTIVPGPGGTAPDGGYPVAGSDAGMPGIESESYAYDGLSRILRAQDEDTRVKRLYDTLSRLTTETSEMSVWTMLGWQAWNSTQLSALTVGYQYDNAGNVTQIAYPGNNGRIVRQSFDPLNRLQQIDDYINAQNSSMIAQYTYMGAGRVSQRRHANDTQVDYAWTGQHIVDPPPPTNEYGFKQVVRTTSQRTISGAKIDERGYLWDHAQNKTATDIASATPEAGPDRTFAYDSSSRLLSSQIIGEEEATYYILDGVHNRQDVSGSLAAGAQVGKYDMAGGAAPYDAETNQYTGTPLDRPVYDLNGNMTGILAQAGGELLMLMGLQQSGPGGALQASIDDAIAAGGQWADLTSDGAVAMDDIGVLGEMMQAQGGGGAGGCGPEDPFCQFQRAVEIAYDYRNQMVEYKDLDNLRTHRYHYDCFGRRVAKVVDHDSASTKTTRYAYGGQASWQVLGEFEGFQPWDAAPLATYVFGNYIDEPIQMRRDLDGPSGGQQPQDFYYHPDELFSVVAITNAGGAVVERVRYGDYGNATVTDASGNTLGDTSTIGNRFAFTGREYDEETDFSYYRTRYMEHQWGRFTTRDTIGTWGDPSNLGGAMAFVASGPTHSIDPLGDKTYKINRQLNPFNRLWLEPRSHYVTHTFIYTTCNGRVLHTYSWGNEYGDESNHWFIDRPEDLHPARKDNARRNARSLVGCGTKPDGHEVGGDELDRIIDELVRELQTEKFSSSNHDFYLFYNCKNEADRLVDLARLRFRRRQDQFWREYGPLLKPGIWL